LDLKFAFAASHLNDLLFYCFENKTVNKLSQFEENSVLCLLKTHKVSNKLETVIKKQLH